MLYKVRRGPYVTCRILDKKIGCDFSPVDTAKKANGQSLLPPPLNLIP